MKLPCLSWRAVVDLSMKTQLFLGIFFFWFSLQPDQVRWGQRANTSSQPDPLTCAARLNNKKGASTVAAEKHEAWPRKILPVREINSCELRCCSWFSLRTHNKLFYCLYFLLSRIWIKATDLHLSVLIFIGLFAALKVSDAELWELFRSKTVTTLCVYIIIYI